jgi:ketosteroid isomerase-like protein
MGDLTTRIRACTAFFIVGLVLSGATAIPIPTEMRAAERLLGPDLTAAGRVPRAAAAWGRTVRDGVFLAETRAPFLLYGTDWLAFGHFMFALAFVGAYRDPIGNRWLFRFGMIACASVPVWALLFGQIRGIPFWWRLIDSSFGIVGFIPVFLCDRWSGQLEERNAPAANRDLEPLLDTFTDAWNRHDVEALMSMMTDDGVFEASAGEHVNGARHEGRRAVRAAYEAVFVQYPDAHWGGARHMVSGNRGVSEWTFTGTSTDGGRVEVNGCDLFTVRDGKIAVKNSFRKNRTPAV